jgi:hypothetical protein
MAHTDTMIAIAQRELEKLVRKDTASVLEPEQTMIRHHRPQPHGPRMLYTLITQIAATSMAVDNLDLLADDDVPEDGKGRKDGREGGLAVDGPERDVVHFETVGEVADAGTTWVCVRNDNDFVASVDEFLDIWVRANNIVLMQSVHLRAGTCDFPRHQAVGRSCR